MLRVKYDNYADTMYMHVHFIKGSRDIQYGHKRNLSTGRSAVIQDVVIERVNALDRSRRWISQPVSFSTRFRVYL